MNRLRPEIDSEVFKINDARVRALLGAKISTEAFALLARPGDPYVLIGNTVYALTEAEFYALRSVYQVAKLSEDAFRRVVDMKDLSFMSKTDADEVEAIRKALPGCSACRYKRYQDKIANLVKKYGIPVKLDDTKGVQEQNNGAYPRTRGTVQSKVTALLSHMYDVPVIDRRPCMDCVEKHVAQAWVLSCEVAQGYPEHLALVVGHLGEALNELPKELTALADTVTYCLARTNYTRRPFVPIGMLVPLINAGRKELAMDTAETGEHGRPLENTLLQLDLDDKAMSEARSFVGGASLADDCRRIDKIILGVENPGDLASLEWEGAMGALADRLVATAPTAANIVRNRRLMFKADPRLASTSGYALADLAFALSSSVDNDSSDSDWQLYSLP